MHRRGGGRPAGGHRPQNNLHSSQNPTFLFGARQIYASDNDLDHIVELDHRNIGDLGNSGIFSFEREQGSSPTSLEVTGFSQTNLS